MLFGKSGQAGGHSMNLQTSRQGGPILRMAPFGQSSDEATEVPLRYLDLDGRPHILYSAANPPLWISWAVTDLVRWRIGERAFVGNARPVDDRAKLESDILPEFTRHFGSDRVSRWFGSIIGCIALSELAYGSSYHAQVEALFDAAAPAYDRTVQADPLNLHPREVSVRVLRNLFPPGSRVLELGCGTGLETIPLVESGVNVVAVDISGKMLAELERKANSASLARRVAARKGLLSDLSEIVSEFGTGSFDGAFSHFGALNCEPSLNGLPEALHRLVKPAGRISLGVLNRTSLLEMVLFSATLRPRRALARLGTTLPAGRSQFGVAVFPRGPGEMRRLFSPFFEVEKTVGVSVFLPPAHLGARLRRRPALLSLLRSIDRSVARRPLCRSLGDYFLTELVRR